MRESEGDVVVVGPASWNTIVQVPRLPDPRPQTLFARDSWATLGGTSAGKALHLVEQGVPVTLSTVIGEDEEADLIRAALSDQRITLVAERVGGRSERHLNLVAEGDRLSIYLSLPTKPPDALPDATRAAIEVATCVVLDLSIRASDAIPLTTQAKTWTDLHDYDGESTFHQPFLDAADVVFMSNDAVGDPRALMTQILAGGKQLVVCTLGSEGAMALDHKGWHHVDAAPTAVVDSNGAGDAFLAGFLAATLAGAVVPEALRAGTTQAVKALGTRHLSPLLDPL